MTRAITALLSIAVLAALPATALGQPGSGGPRSQGPVPVPPPPAAASKLRISVDRLVVSDGRRVAPYGSRPRIRVQMRPWATGQTVRVKVSRDGQKVLVRRLRLQKVKGQNVGRAMLGFDVTKPGHYRVSAGHDRSPQIAATVAATRRFLVRLPSASPGDRSPGVRLLQRLLAQRGYAVPRSGVYDDGTARAVLAFRKVNRMARTTLATREVFQRLAAGGAFKLRYPGAGKHVEVDLGRQVMALTRNGRPYRVYHVSTGAFGTPPGRYHFYSHTPGYNAKGMFMSVYFRGGYAIHGYASVPPYPASHGCVRMPIPNAVFVYNWVNNGDRIDIYR